MDLKPPRRALIVLAIVATGLVAFGMHRVVRADRQSQVRISAPGRPELSIPLPSYSLLDQDGRPFTPAEARGSVWIVSFIFTRCPSICPLLTAKMKKLTEQTGDVAGLRFVSISVDPENDTPQVLGEYARKAGADPARWRFVTGDQREIERTVTEGFKLALGRDATGALVHAERFVLVDGEGRIRGYFDADDDGQRDLLVAARRLADAL
jgi:protein SCO1/2